MRFGDIALKDALRMATSNPGAFVGSRDRLAVGARADLVRFRWREKLVLTDVWLAGERVQGSGE